MLARENLTPCTNKEEGDEDVADVKLYGYSLPAAPTGVVPLWFQVQ